MDKSTSLKTVPIHLPLTVHTGCRLMRTSLPRLFFEGLFESLGLCLCMLNSLTAT